MFEEPMPTFFNDYFGEPDFRSKKWILTNSPKWPLIIFFSYFIFIYLGTRIMRNRKQFNLKFALIMHNYFQIVLSTYIFKEILLSAIKIKKNSFICLPLNKTNDPNALRMAEAFWYFYASKFYDLFDTVFLVLRKKTHQLSFLHIYHHATMLFNWYLCVVYLPGGQSYLTVLLNAFVHIVMYSYYFLAAFGPWTQKYLWWKKYLTQIQLTQFLIVVGHVSYGYFTGCDQPGWLSIFSVLYLFTLIALFMNFYLKAYLKNKRRSKPIKKSIFTLPSKSLDFTPEETNTFSKGDKKDL